MRMISDKTAGQIAIILVAGVCLSFMVLLAGVLWIAIDKDGPTTSIVLTAFTTLAGAMAGALSLIIQHYLVGRGTSTDNGTNVTVSPSNSPQPTNITIAPSASTVTPIAQPAITNTPNESAT